MFFLRVIWSVMLLWSWICVCRLPVQAQEALLVSRIHAPTQDTKGPASFRTVKKRSVSDAEKVEVYNVTVDCTVASRFARTVMTSSAVNKADLSKEVFFKVELPKTSFITNFSMEIDGQFYVGEVKEKEKAKKQYEKAVSSGQTAGLVKASGRKMEKFSVSVNIAANSSVTFILTYEELLQRKFGHYEILTRVTPKQLVQSFQIEVNIYEPQGIAFVDTNGTFLSNELLPLVKKTVTHTKAHISFSPTLDQQRKCPDCNSTLIDGDFIIQYDVTRARSLGDIQIVNGYFVHFFAPPDLPRVPKNVVFVIDKSGSMAGTKISQTREALVAILQDLHEADHFALIQFSSNTITWKDSLTKASKGNVAKAVKYVKRIREDGATNINAAVLRAVKMVKTDRKDNKLPTRSVDMIILLTDGMPNEGEINLSKIQENVHHAINGEMALFCLGFGRNVDYSFLDMLAKQNKGVARRIYEASDATLQLQGFYKEVASPLLSEVDLRYPNKVDLLTTHHFSRLFNGSEIVVAGRVTDNDIDDFLVEVFGKGPEEDFQAHGQTSGVDWDAIYPEQDYIFGNFTERLWAYLTIQQLQEQSEIGTEQERSDAAAKALDMSLQYSFVTPLTSMVVTKPETEEGPGSSLIANKLTEDQRQKAEKSKPMSHSYLAGPSGVHPASHGVSDVDGDPHFMIELPEREDALCFNIDDTPGTIFNLVRDPASGIWVNGQIILKRKFVPDGKVNTYFGRFGIVHQILGVRLQVTTQDISVSLDGEWMKLMWSDTGSLKRPKMDLTLTKNCSLTVTLKDSFRFMVVRHTKVWKSHHYQQDYLGFYTLDSHLMSPGVHGLLGQFYHGVDYEVGILHPGEDPETANATMFVKGWELKVTRHWERDFRRDVKNGEKIPCWFVHRNGTGLIDGSVSDYIVSGLFKTVRTHSK